MSDKAFLSTGEAAELIGVHAVTVFRAVEAGQLKALRTPGGHYRIARADLEAYMRRLHVGAARVLVVEDHAAEQRAMVRALSHDTGWEVTATASGIEAGLLIASTRPHVLVLDVFLRDRDGRQVVRLLRADPQLKGVKVLVVTGGGEAVARDALKAGADEVLHKPFAPGQLRAAVERLLG